MLVMKMLEEGGKSDAGGKETEDRVRDRWNGGIEVRIIKSV